MNCSYFICQSHLDINSSQIIWFRICASWLVYNIFCVFGGGGDVATGGHGEDS